MDRDAPLEFEHCFAHDGAMIDPLYESVRAALESAMKNQQRVALVLRGDLTTGLGVRTLEGVPYEIAAGRDGRERVFMRIAEETEQIVLLERVAKVLTGFGE